jgi:putative spermidine/putrescine transport system substrate-binding protein
LQTEGVTLTNIAMLRTQKAQPSYSVVMLDDVGLPIAKAEGLIAKLDASKIPNLANVFKRFVYNDAYGVGFAVSTVAPFYRTDLKNPPLNFADLWDERYRGRLMLITPKQTSSVQLLTVAASLATGKPILEAQYELDKGWAKLAELKPNVQTIYEQTGNAVLQITQEQADIAGPDFSKQVWPYIKRGAPIRITTPKEGVFAGVNCITLVANAPEPDLGAAFIDRVLSPSVQKGLAEETYASPSVFGVELNPETRAMVAYPESKMNEMKLWVLDWDHINRQRSTIIDKWNQIFV